MLAVGSLAEFANVGRPQSKMRSDYPKIHVNSFVTAESAIYQQKGFGALFTKCNLIEL